MHTLLSERRRYERAACCRIPTIRQSQKYKTMEAVENSAVARGSGRGRDEEAKHKRLFEQRKHSVLCYNDGYVSSHHTLVQTHRRHTARSE